MTALELLAPARTADIGIEAIRHGADAVYIGAESFGARKAAGNSVQDIARLVDYAHVFGVKVYVTVNTILYEDELSAVEKLIHELHAIGVDALIVQDMGILRLDIPPIPLHASTQMDNRTPEKVKALNQMGFKQAVLARELSLEEIKAIHSQCPEMRLEAFVHGALCVSLSGRCYASEALFGRSANRGECAQVCRMAMDLVDGKGNILVKNKHLLSLKDLCQLNSLPDLALAGVTSFKIEGRLKDMSYVKNVTAAYSEALNQFIATHTDRFCRASYGNVDLSFQPDVEKSFNRGFTHYFLYGSNDDIFSLDTPKAIGKEVGRIKEIYTDSIVVDSRDSQDITFNNGDGLCCFDKGGHLIGFRINRAERNRLYLPRVPVNIRKGMKLFRNYDKRFEDSMNGESAKRYISINMTLDFDASTSEFVLTLKNEDESICTTNRFSYQPELAHTHQQENIRKQLSKLGNTPLRLKELSINYKDNYFIPSSMLSEWRRKAAEAFLSHSALRHHPTSELSHSITPQLHNLVDGDEIFSQDTVSAIDGIDYHHNVANHLSETIYKECGASHVDSAYELKHQENATLMTCRHCIRYAMGWCLHKQQQSTSSTPTEPLYLVLQNGKRLRLEFDCIQCVMRVRNAQ